MENIRSKPEIVMLQEITNVADDNVDVLVRLSSGETRTVTFFTISSIASIMESYRSTGECLAGSYFWAKDLVIVKDLRRETIEAAVFDMIASGEYDHAFGP